MSLVFRMVTGKCLDFNEYEAELLVSSRIENYFGVIGGACNIRVLSIIGDEISIVVNPKHKVSMVAAALFFVTSYRGEKCRIVLKDVSKV